MKNKKRDYSMNSNESEKAQDGRLEGRVYLTASYKN